MGAVSRSRLWIVGVSVAGVAAAVAVLAQPSAAEPRSSTAAARQTDQAVVDRLEKYLAHAERGKAEAEREKPRAKRVAQNRDDLLAQPAPAAPSKPAGDDLLTPAPAAPGGDNLLAPGGGDLLSPGGGGNEDLLTVRPPGGGNTEDARRKQEQDEALRKAADAEHQKLFLETKYPSAATCATCHVKQFEEWSVSQHAYAQLSPIFNAMQTKINVNTVGTNGDFCVRCHTPLGMNLVESVYGSNLKRSPASREGLTCVACHRVNMAYGKISARMGTVEGDIFSPVYGPKGNAELKRVLSKPEEYRVVTSKDQVGRGIHTKVEQAFFLTRSMFCGSCHDVTLLNGFKLEEAFTEFKAGTGSKQGTTCQDCHMGLIQGKPSGYDFGPAAIVGGVPSRDRKITNHSFAGPDYSVIHPGLFPFNPDAIKFKSGEEWLQFNYKAGWGTDEFENTDRAKSFKFPKAWESRDDRYDAQAILKVQFGRLAKIKKLRYEVLRNGIHLSEVKVLKQDASGLDFSVDVINATPGHGVPTGFDGERLYVVEVDVRDSRGKRVYASGDRDPNGDVRDTHSLYVHNGELPLDKDLFSLQSIFIVRQQRGGEREQILPTNRSVDVLAFVRPETRATTLVGNPLGARKHKQNIETGGRRTPVYRVPAEKLRSGERYTITAQFRTQMVPVNLIAEVQDVGFDYGMSAAELGRAVMKESIVLWTRKATVVLK